VRRYTLLVAGLGLAVAVTSSSCATSHPTAMSICLKHLQEDAGFGGAVLSAKATTAAEAAMRMDRAGVGTEPWKQATAVTSRGLLLVSHPRRRPTDLLVRGQQWPRHARATVCLRDAPRTSAARSVALALVPTTRPRLPGWCGRPRGVWWKSTIRKCSAIPFSVKAAEAQLDGAPFRR